MTLPSDGQALSPQIIIFRVTTGRSWSCKGPDMSTFSTLSGIDERIQFKTMINRSAEQIERGDQQCDDSGRLGEGKVIEQTRNVQ